MKPIALATLLTALLIPSAFAQDWRQDVQVVGTDADPAISLRGKTAEDKLDGLAERSWSLVTSVDKKTKQVSTSLQFGMWYQSTAWQNWRMAATVDGRALEVLSVKKALMECKGACTFFEQLNVDLPRALLDEAAVKPVQLRFRSEFGGEQIITVDPATVALQRAAAAATVASLP